MYERRRLVSFILLFLVIWPACSALELEKCVIHALGMESGTIEDSQISASSSFDAQSVGPQNARIRTEKASGAWCPKVQIRNGSYEFLQLNLNSTFVLRAIETQGRYGNGTGREFAQQYMLDYWRHGSTKWIRYRNRNGSHLIDANSDTITAVMRLLDPPIIASKIRLVPYSIQTRTTCLRMEAYGCEYKDGLMFYTMSKPASNTGIDDFTDETFEDTDKLDPTYQTNSGLGLLTDGIVPKHAPVDPHFHLPIRNSTWLGWQRNITDGQVEIKFDFDQNRRFTDVELFGFGKPIDVVEVEFADEMNGEFGRKIPSRYPDSLDLATKPDLYSIRVPLNDHWAQYVKIRLIFTSDWAYLSEVRFNTDLSNATSLLNDFRFDTENPPGLYYIFVALLCVLFVIMTTALCLIMFWKRRRSSSSSDKLSSLGSPSSRSTAATSLSREIKPGTLITTLPINGGQPRHVIHSHSFAPHQSFLCQHKGNLYVGDHRAAASTQRILGLAPPMRSCSGTLFKDHPPSLLDIHFPPPPPTTEGQSNSSSEGIYAEPCSTAPLLPSSKRSLNCSMPGSRRPVPKPRSRDSLNRRNRTLPLKARVEEDEQHYAIARLSPLLQERSASNPRLQPFSPASLPAPRILRRSTIQLLEKIGEGKFTNVFSCRIRDEQDGTERLACIKQLHMDNEAARMALISESRLCNDLTHEHLNRFMGQCEDLSVVTELCQRGDVRSFILNERDTIDYPTVLSFCTGIAAGLTYLEQCGVIHGHLSPKCCLLDGALRIRVAAPRGPNHHAQLRYSAPEAIVLNSWSHESDAFSFAMTAWELMHYCDAPPLHNLSNNDLIANARLQLDGSPNAMYPELDVQPQDPEMADLLRECWSTMAERRPGFLEMHVFLQRKQLSFSRR